MPNQNNLLNQHEWLAALTTTAEAVAKEVEAQCDALGHELKAWREAVGPREVRIVAGEATLLVDL